MASAAKRISDLSDRDEDTIEYKDDNEVIPSSQPGKSIKHASFWQDVHDAYINGHLSAADVDLVGSPSDSDTEPDSPVQRVAIITPRPEVKEEKLFEEVGDVKEGRPNVPLSVAAVLRKKLAEDEKKAVAKAKGTGKANNRSRDWCLTSFKPSDKHKEHDATPLYELLSDKDKKKIGYMVYVKQAASETGQLHWQGFIQVAAQKGYSRGDMVKLFDGIDDSIHLERRLKSVEACVRYIKDDLKKTNCSQIYEHGTVKDMGTEAGKAKKGKAGSREDLKAIMKEVRQHKMSRAQFFEKYPDLAGRHFEAQLFNGEELKRKHIMDEVAEWKGDPWSDSCNKRIKDYLFTKPGRKLVWVWSNTGGVGKSTRAKFFENYLIDLGKKGQLITNGATARDIATLITPDMEYFIFDLARSTSENEIPYSIIEGLSNGLITSGKYVPKNIKMDGPVHIIIFSNTVPDVSKLSADRFKGTEICLDPIEVQRDRLRLAEVGDAHLNMGNGHWVEQKGMISFNKAGLKRAEADLKKGMEEKNHALTNSAQAQANMFQRQLSLLGMYEDDKGDSKRSPKRSKVDDGSSQEVMEVNVAMSRSLLDSAPAADLGISPKAKPKAKAKPKRKRS